MHHLRAEKRWGRWWSLERDRGKGALQIFAGQTEIKGKQPGLIRGLHLMQGLTGMGAGPAVRLVTDGHFPREQDLAGRGLGVGAWRNVTSGRGGREIRLPGPASESAGTCRRRESQWPDEVASMIGPLANECGRQEL
jgi:hypothetical protein